MADLVKFWEAWTDTAPNKLENLSDEHLAAFYHYFSEAHTETGDGKEMRAAAGRRDELRHEIAKREAARQHKQAIALGKQTLKVGQQGTNWARIAAIAGIAAAAIAAVTLVVQIYVSTVPPATPQASSPSPQTTATIAASPVQDASNATPSVQPMATASPSGSP